mmetsp:Transcript_11431/g.28942  ORF Transcript_11431/g.28942 Transcript_11431/m.28942 type:complete len:341 (-) Transcript_11431:95-1117(-)
MPVNEPPRRTKRDRQLGQTHARLLRDLRVLLHRRHHALPVEPLLKPAGKLGKPRAAGGGPVAVLPREDPPREDAPREESDVEVGGRAGLRELGFEGAVDKAEGVLDGDGAGHAEAVRGEDCLADAEGCLVGEAVGADLPGVEELFQCEEGFVDGDVVRAFLGGFVGGDAEAGDPAVGPVELVEVDVVGAEAAERRVAGLDDACAVEAARGGALHGRVVPPGQDAFRGGGAGRGGFWGAGVAHDLGGDDEVGAKLLVVGEPAADVLLGGARNPARVTHRDRVHLGSVDEVDASGFDCVVELCGGFGVRVLDAEGHGSKTYGRDEKCSGVSEEAEGEFRGEW